MRISIVIGLQFSVIKAVTVEHLEAMFSACDTRLSGLHHARLDDLYRHSARRELIT